MLPIRLVALALVLPLAACGGLRDVAPRSVSLSIGTTPVRSVPIYPAGYGYGRDRWGYGGGCWEIRNPWARERCRDGRRFGY
jgi:hypothetical protein